MLADFDIAALQIIKYPDPRLRKVCQPVEAFDESLRRLAERMLELMHAHKGIGLAAPQVGLLLRMFVCNVTEEARDDMVFVNPEVFDLEGQATGEEGCLSIPDVTINVRRAVRCTIAAKTPAGQPIEKTGADLLARCWQHECDHLDGRLITDRMSEADRIANRRILKQLESEYRSGRR